MRWGSYGEHNGMGGGRFGCGSKQANRSLGSLRGFFGKAGPWLIGRGGGGDSK